MLHSRLARTLTACLQLDRPPVGLAFVSDADAALERVTRAAPSACTFWRRAEESVFYATANDHTACPIGLMTMGFEPDAEAATRAQETIGLFVQLEYFSASEVAHLPKITLPHDGVVYGPLAELPMAPDVVLVVASPFQAMLLAEAGGSMALGERVALAAMGRPACAAIPRAVEVGETTMSFACIGARTYAEIPEDRVLLAIPGPRLAETVDRLETLQRANAELERFHAAQRAAFMVEAPAS